MNKNENKMKYIIGMIIAMLLWGIAWTSGKAAVEHSNAQVASFWRYFIAFVGMIPVVLYMKKSLKTDFLGYIYIVLGGLLSALFSYLFFAGLSHGDAGYGGTMFTSLVPMITYFLSMIIFSTKVSLKQLISLGIGIFGAIILLRIPMEGLDFLNLNSIYFLMCALVWALVTIITQKVSNKVDPMFYTLVLFGVTAFTNMLFALPYHPFEIALYDSIFWLNIVFIGLLSGTFAMTIFFVSASKIGAHNTAVFMFVVPIGAIVSSYFAYSEKIALSTIIGCLLSLIAVILSSKNHRFKKVKLKIT
ncbi:EamA/RhaT family transporter [Malaciobacter halophilus]|nr:DMT family transporter [Malaciobacter halophilus]RYA22544.1 EamA/RhaT family transporter [Malaciobacter halophilus]